MANFLIQNYQMEDFIKIMIENHYTVEITKYDENFVLIKVKEEEKN